MPPDPTDTAPSSDRQDPPALAAGPRQEFRVREVELTRERTVQLGPDDQAFFIGLTRNRQWPTTYRFVVLEAVDAT